MAAATLTSKGQLVIPKTIREHMQVQTGDRIDFIVRDDGEVVIRPLVRDVTALKGLLVRRRRKPVSVSAMNEAIRKGVGRRSR